MNPAPRRRRDIRASNHSTDDAQNLSALVLRNPSGSFAILIPRVVPPDHSREIRPEICLRIRGQAFSPTPAVVRSLGPLGHLHQADGLGSERGTGRCGSFLSRSKRQDLFRVPVRVARSRRGSLPNHRL